MKNIQNYTLMEVKNSILWLRQFWDLHSHISPLLRKRAPQRSPFSPDAPHCPCTTACIEGEMHTWIVENEHVFLLQRATCEDKSQSLVETRRWGRRNVMHPWRGTCSSSTWVQVLTVLHMEMQLTALESQAGICSGICQWPCVFGWLAATGTAVPSGNSEWSCFRQQSPRHSAPKSNSSWGEVGLDIFQTIWSK